MACSLQDTSVTGSHGLSRYCQARPWCMLHPSAVPPIGPVEELSKRHANPVVGAVARGVEASRQLPRESLSAEQAGTTTAMMSLMVKLRDSKGGS